MCGILGVRRDFLADAAHVERALERLRWRGRDGSRVLAHGAWWLGVARLAITDRGAAQPIRSRDGRHSIVFNGAVTSAAREWGDYAGEAQTKNDAELPLLRYLRHGASALADMTGPYAFGIVDAADRGELWLGRDPLGEKPLYLLRRRSDGAVLAFASTVGALRALGARCRYGDLSRAALLAYGCAVDAWESGADASHHVESLPSGIWSVDATHRLQRVETAPEPRPTEFEPALRGAVVRCASAEVPVGLSLSGGIDSACIAAVLRDRGLPAYQFRAVGEPGDERERARAAAAWLGHRLRCVDGDASILRELPALTAMAAQPLGDPSVLAAFAVARAAAADGVRVLLSGEGADDLLLGYRRQRAIARLPRRALRWLAAPLSRLPAIDRSSGARARIVRAAAAERPYAELLRVVAPEFAREVLRPPFAVPPALPEPAGSAGEPSDELERARWLDREFYLRHDLLQKLDIATLAAGVEGRCPFLDPEVLRSDAVREVEPRRMLGKRALRRAFTRELPPGFFRQPKTGFAVPLARWLREDDWLADILRERRTLQRAHIDAPGLTLALDRHRRGARDHGRALYLLVALELYDRVAESTEPA